MSEEDEERKHAYDFKQDVWTSSEEGDLKGNPSRDAIARQSPTSQDRLSNEYKSALYHSDPLAASIADNFAEDLTRNWLSIEIPNNEALGRTVQQHLERLNARSEFQDLVRYDVVYGDGYISVGVNDNKDNNEKPIENLDGIEYLHAFSPKKVNGQELVEDPFDPNYSAYEYYNVETPATADEFEMGVHPDRIVHYQTRHQEGEEFGRSDYQRYLSLFKHRNNATWSLGQILYQLNFKVYHTDLSQMDDDKEEDIREMLEHAWTSNTLAMVDNGGDSDNEESIELPSTSQNVSGLEDMLEWIKSQIAMATRIPKSVLFGAQSGTLSASETDAMSYFNRISGLQETYLREKIAKVVKYIMKGEGTDPDSLEWKIDFNPLWNLDQMTESEIDFNKAKAASLLAQSGVMPVDEIREKFYEQEPIQPKTPEETEEDAEWYKEVIDEYEEKDEEQET